MQLDIFEHSRDVGLRNAVLQALQARDEAAARAACKELAAAYPHDYALPDLRALADALPLGAGASFPDHDAAAATRRTVADCVQPAALRCFNDRDAHAWLAPLWRGLAQRAAGVPFRPDHADDHAAALLLQAGDWRAAVAAVERIPSWRRIPAPLAWMAHARLRQLGLLPTWPLIAELAWLAPGRLEQLVHASSDALLVQLVGHFEREFDGAAEPGGFAWLPAWVLTYRPQHASALAMAQASQHTPPEQALRLMVELLGLEKQGRQQDLVQRRKDLRDLHPGLYALYMRTR